MKHIQVPAVTPRRLRAIMLVAAAVLVAALLVYVAIAERNGQEATTNGQQRDVAVGAAEKVIDCVQDPEATPDECEDEAQQAQQALEQKVPPVNLTKSQRREVLLIASELIAARPLPSEDAIVDAVLARLPDVEDGDQGPRGRQGEQGAPGDTPTTAEIRALVQQVYIANPPPPGEDGSDGANGSDGAQGGKGEKGDTGPRGPEGPTGPQGPAGPAGADGAPGQPGQNGADGAPARGIASLTCDTETQMFVVTYTDGTSQPVEGSDCVAGGGLGLR